uniref:Uncharacterized protein n=1 Tax=Phocoena sinus TaxID=42100 RepID=A0A8C9BFU8_PHOSS
LGHLMNKRKEYKLPILGIKNKLQLGGDADMEERAFPNPFREGLRGRCGHASRGGAAMCSSPPGPPPPVTPNEFGFPFHNKQLHLLHNLILQQLFYSLGPKARLLH